MREAGSTWKEGKRNEKEGEDRPEPISTRFKSTHQETTSNSSKAESGELSRDDQKDLEPMKSKEWERIRSCGRSKRQRNRTHPVVKVNL